MSTAILVEGENDQSVAARLDALRCDLVKTALYPVRHAIASEIMSLVREDPTLKDVDEGTMNRICTDTMFYFGDDVFEALQGLTTPPSGTVTLGDKIQNLRDVLQSYFQLRTLK